MSWFTDTDAVAAIKELSDKVAKDTEMVRVDLNTILSGMKTLSKKLDNLDKQGEEKMSAVEDLERVVLTLADGVNVAVNLLKQLVTERSADDPKVVEAVVRLEEIQEKLKDEVAASQVSGGVVTP